LNPSSEKEKIIDLTIKNLGLGLGERFVCDKCGLLMLEYHSPKSLTENPNPHAGKSYICGKCGTIIDSSYTPMRHEDVIKPLDYDNKDPESMIAFVDEDSNKGLKRPSDEVFDPDPQHDKWLQDQGFVIKSKYIERSTGKA
jgi:hypothetical protein